MLVFAKGRVEHQNLHQIAAKLPTGWMLGIELNSQCQKSSLLSDARDPNGSLESTI